MPLILTDDEIAQLIAEPKPLPAEFRMRILPKRKRGHKEREMEIQGESGHRFRLIARESSFNPIDFSIILGYVLPGSNIIFRLRRYNGRSHEHTNKIERETFYAFHIHFATARYQETGFSEDAYAEITDRYSDFLSALECIINDCAFRIPPEPQMSLL